MVIDRRPSILNYNDYRLLNGRNKPVRRLIFALTRSMLGPILNALLPLALANAQSPPVPSPNPGNMPPPQANNQGNVTLTPDQRIALLEEQMKTALALKNAEVQELKDRIEYISKLVGLIGVFMTLVIAFLTIRDTPLPERKKARDSGALTISLRT